MPIVRIYEHIYLSDKTSGRDEEELQRYGIKKSICMAQEMGDPEYSDQSIRYYHFPLSDYPVDETERNYKAIETAWREACAILDIGVPTVVFCQLGVSRSPAVIVRWLMTRKNYGYEDAVDYINSRSEWEVRPNSTFRNFLISLRPSPLSQQGGSAHPSGASFGGLVAKATLDQLL